MLYTADAELISRDRSLPGLRTLLDPELFSGLLERLDIELLRNCYIRYKPQTNCLSAYDVLANGKQIRLYAKAFRKSDAPKFMKRKDGLVIFPDEAIAIYLYPHDAKLPSLGRLHTPAKRRDVFQKMLASFPELWESEPVQLRYKPERRYVGKLVLNNRPVAVIRCYTESDFAAACENAELFQSTDRVHFSRKLGHSTRRHWIAYQWVEGSPLEVAAASPAQFFNIGAALATVHNQRPERIRYRTRETWLEHLLSQLGFIAFLFPDEEEQINTFACKLASLVMEQPVKGAPIHGDFHCEQVLLQPDNRIAILDLDEIGFGDTAIDLGNFCAHMERDVVLGKIPQDRASQAFDALMEGYRSLRSRSQQLKLYTAIGLLKLVTEPFRLRHPKWNEIGRAILQRSQALLSAGIALRPHHAGETAALSFNADPRMPFLKQALSAPEMENHLKKTVSFPFAGIQNIGVTRHKRGRRCLIEYELQTEQGHLTLLGKIRAKGLNKVGYETLLSLHSTGFDSGSDDLISVPKPEGKIPELCMYLQRKVKGISASELFRDGAVRELPQRIAAALFKLHRSGVSVSRHHSLHDELQILEDGLNKVSAQFPVLSYRIETILLRCKQIASVVEDDRVCTIHRDFYPDQVLISGERIFLLDFDCFSVGPPLLDVGNFLAHITELSFRHFGDPVALGHLERVFSETYRTLARSDASVAQAYRLLSLVRHIYLSTQFEDRMHLTVPLLELCERETGQFLISAERSA